MTIFLTIIGGIVLTVGMALLMALPTMWLWNYLMPVIFGLIKIHFWQAFWMNVLTGILFKSTSSSK